MLLRAARTACDGLCAPATVREDGGRSGNGPIEALVSYDSDSSTSRLSSANVTRNANLGWLSDEEAKEPLLAN